MGIITFIVGLVSGTVGLASGWLMSRVQLLFRHDAETINRFNDLIDSATIAFLRRYDPDESQPKYHAQLLDYRISELVSDISLKPIIGQKSLDNELTTLFGELFTLSKVDLSDLQDAEVEKHCEKGRTITIKAKNLVKKQSGKFRLIDKK